MDWLNILDQVFDVCLVPLLGLITSILIVYIKEKIVEGKEKTNSELADKYLSLLEITVIDCIRATNQTYVNALKDKNAFDDEMKSYGLTDEERAILHEQLDISSGLCIAQEQFMKLVQLPECGGWDLQWSDKLRKAIAKKNPKDYVTLEKQFFERVKEQQLSENFCNYVWNRQIALSKGYGFNALLWRVQA